MSFILQLDSSFRSQGFLTGFIDSPGESESYHGPRPSQETFATPDIPRHGSVMSPYEFTSKTHSLSTEDLEKKFIDSFTFQHCGNILL